MDKYDASNDHYCYSGTSVLKNLLNIQNMDELEIAEREVTSFTVTSIRYQAPPYNLEYLQQLHRYLFSSLYSWAGELRDVDIRKGGTYFCNCRFMISEATKLFNKLENNNWLAGLSKDEFCEKLAFFYCEFNMIHPFREGNGRVQRLFFEHIALSAGYELDWENVEQNEWIRANIDGVNVSSEPMKMIFKRIVTSCNSNF